MTVMLGVTTFNRPRYLEKCLRAINTHIKCDGVIVHNDGSDSKFKAEYERAYKKLPGVVVQDSTMNHGVAKSKNALLSEMLDMGADWLFLVEDDITVLSSEAMTGYIEACERSGVHHLAFAHHGPANLNIPDEDGPVSHFTHSIGAWTIFSRACLHGVGLFDTHMLNAFEHVEHDMRLIQAGYMPECGPHRFPDASGSAQWLTEIPGSLEHSSIRPRNDWQQNIRSSLIYWRDEKPETYNMLFGDDMPLHNYALSIIG